MNDPGLLELDLLSETEDLNVSRRSFLKLAGTGIFLTFTVGVPQGLAQQQRPRGGMQSLPADFNAYLRIGEDGRVTLYSGKIEMGQGVVTSLPQELAEELDVPLEKVNIVMGDTELCPWDTGTSGSRSTRQFGQAVRLAGAKARRVMLEMGSERLHVPVEKLAAENGVVFVKADHERKVSYADLAKGKTIERQPSGTVDLKKPQEFRVMNRPVKRRDGLEKVTGKARYAADILLPDMLYARILRPPSHDAKLADVDLSAAKAVSGVQVVHDGDLIAVLHRSPDVAEEARGKIQAKFDTPPSALNENSIFEHFEKSIQKGDVVSSRGDVKAGEGASKAVIEQVYLNDYVAHSPMEPHAALASVDGKKITIWASTQAPFRVKEEVARTLGYELGDVRIITPYLGGGFGGKTPSRQAVEAARLSRLTGKPVQVAWTRKEEFFYDTFRPAALINVRSGVDGNGGISFWDYKVYCAGQRGADMLYDTPHHRIMAYNGGWGGSSGVHPFAVGAWRAPGNNSNTFARESQIDVMAARAGMDPLEFRLRNLSDKKLKNVLTTAAKEFGWKPGKAGSGSGFGIACGTDVGTAVATCAEVSVDKSTGAVQVTRVVAVQDMGVVVNPEGAKIQMEGCITMGLGYALKEGMHFKGGELLDVNFDSYEIPRFSWLPEIRTVIVDNREDDPQGGGEPAVITMGAVIANAIYDAVGVRVAQLPMPPDRVKAAFAKG